jgi:hypothetical protein
MLSNDELWDMEPPELTKHFAATRDPEEREQARVMLAAKALMASYTAAEAMKRTATWTM